MVTSSFRFVSLLVIAALLACAMADNEGRIKSIVVKKDAQDSKAKENKYGLVQKKLSQYSLKKLKKLKTTDGYTFKQSKNSVAPIRIVGYDKSNVPKSAVQYGVSNTKYPVKKTVSSYEKLKTLLKNYIKATWILKKQNAKERPSVGNLALGLGKFNAEKAIGIGGVKSAVFSGVGQQSRGDLARVGSGLNSLTRAALAVRGDLNSLHGPIERVGFEIGEILPGRIATLEHKELTK